MGQENVFAGFEAALKEAELFKSTLMTSGLHIKHKVIDNTNYYLVPVSKKTKRELAYYVDIGKRLQGRTVLELNFEGTSCHRVIWDEIDGWLYEFDKLDKKPIEEAFDFMHHLQAQLGRGFSFGEELPISRDQAEIIAREFAGNFISKSSRPRAVT